MNTFTAEAKIELKKLDPGRDWSHLPDYECASEGLKEYWYPVLWSRELKKKQSLSFLWSQNHADAGQGRARSCAS